MSSNDKPGVVAAVAEKRSSFIPSTASLASEQNQRLMLNLGLKMNVGLIASGLVSMLVFKRTGSRAFMTGIGAGSGLGYAWCENDFYLKDPKLNDKMIPKSLESEISKYWKKVDNMVPNFAKFK